jgi:hypothetical protein
LNNLNPLIKKLAAKCVDDACNKRDADTKAIAKFVLRQQKGSTQQPQASGELMQRVVNCWRQSVREGDRGSATRLLSIAVGVKGFSKTWKRQFDDVLGVFVGSPVFIVQKDHMRRNWCV